MNQRDLALRLDELATRIEELSTYPALLEVANELRFLSNQNYAPGNGTTWEAIKPKSTKKTFTDKSGRKMPF